LRDLRPVPVGLPREQQLIRAHCVHSTGAFVEFRREEIEQSIPARFEQQVRRYPERLAVETSGHSLTYAELNHAANRVARAILSRPGGGNEPVAVLLEQGAPAIIAMLGVLKAGKIYVPLDPAFPRARLAYMLEDSQAELVVTNSRNLSLAKASGQSGCQVMNVDELDAGLCTGDLGLPLSPTTLAYVVYTSGSTGQPKGVVQNHRNVLHKIMTPTNDFHICPQDRLCLLYSCSVGVGVRNIFCALLNGAALYPLDIKTVGLGDLAAWLIQEDITVYHSVATVFRHLLDTLTGREQFPELRLIFVSGEPVYPRDVERYKARFASSCVLVHGLGLAELSLARQYYIDKQTRITGSMVPVGYAVDGVKVLLVDEAGQEVDFNRVGEIALESPYLTLGYWRKPDLTRAAFLPDPAGGDARIYRTGDLGRMLPDGRLDHLGRKDFQVKVRGYRIEAGEIEGALLGSAEIKEAVVVAREDWRGEQHLVAYIVPAGTSAPSASTLRRALTETLPDYMLPSAFVTLTALPLTPTGKVDRRALPAPGRARPELETPFVTARTPVERVLAGIWEEVLGLDRVGIHDDFLDLGGHSLLATQIASRIRDVFRADVPLRSLFEAATVADMTVAIVQHVAEKVECDRPEPPWAEVERLSEDEVRRRLTDDA